jgi:sulfate adenylyltransferase subunit 1 (EFTu-like GTPase family)
VAYRYFATPTRKFIIADTPGHEQYTRNMVTGASTADAAVLIVDAQKGLLVQTRRHSYLVSLLGIRHIVVAVNKMDLVGYAESRFRAIADEYRGFAERIGLENVTFIPVSALKGDNVVVSSANIPWHRGSTLMGYLESVPIDEERQQKLPFRLPVQWVNRRTRARAALGPREPRCANRKRRRRPAARRGWAIDHAHARRRDRHLPRRRHLARRRRGRGCRSVRSDRRLDGR